MKTPLALGLIGAGVWGRNYIRSLGSLEQAELVHVVTRESVVAELPANCQSCHDWRALISSGNIDGLIIASPAALHEEMSVLALENAIPVLLEKPPALTEDGAKRLLDISREHKTILQINYIDLENPAWQVLQENLSIIGELESVELDFGGPGPVRADTSCLWDWGPHPLAVSIRLLGDELPVIEKAVRQQEEGETGEKLQVQMKVGDTKISCTIANNRERKARRIHLRGKQGELSYDSSLDEGFLLEVGGDKSVLKFTDKPPLVSAIERFCKSIRTADYNERDGLLGVKVNRLLENIEDKLIELNA